MLPGGEWVLFTLVDLSANWDSAQIVAQSITGGTRRVLIDGGADGRYLSTGHLLYAVGGTVFTLIGAPAGLVSGSLLSVAAASLLGRPMMVPRPLSRVLSVLVGISLGAVVTPETLQGLFAFPLSITIMLVSTACMMAATTSYLCYVHGWDAQTALFGASPGALAQVMTLAAEYGADLRKIAIVQVMRVVDSHQEIVDAIEASDPRAAGACMERHFDDARRALARAREKAK